MSNPEPIDLPCSELHERVLLSCITKNPDIMDQATFRAEMFSMPSHQIMYNHLADLYTDSGMVDWPAFVSSFSLSELSEVGGKEGLNDMWSEITPEQAWTWYYESVLSLYKRRTGIVEMRRAMARLHDKNDDIGEVKDIIERAMAKMDLDEPLRDVSDREMLQEVWDNVLKRKEGQGMIELSNLRALNLAMGCSLPGDQIVIGAESSFGKTSLAMHFVTHLALGRQRKRVAVFSMEMRAQAMGERMLSSQAEVPLQDVRANRMNDDQKLKICKFIAEVKDGHYIFMDDNSQLDIRSIVSRCRRIKKKYGLDVVVVDYIQLVSPASMRSNVNRQQEVADISRKLKVMAIELDVVVVALSQLNEAGQLRESRAIGQDADVVMIITEGSSEDAFERTIKISKNRNGPSGSPVKVHFYPQYVSFADK